MKREKKLYLSLGSNIGDRNLFIKQALEKIEERIGKLVSLSALYETAPEGFISESPFLNAACKVKTPLSPEEILRTTQDIERELGRTHKSVDQDYSDRSIDIDILLIDNIVIEQPDFKVPHPRLHLRNFVLEPLSEIASNIEHPILLKTVKELLKENSI